MICNLFEIGFEIVTQIICIEKEKCLLCKISVCCIHDIINHTEFFTHYSQYLVKHLGPQTTEENILFALLCELDYLCIKSFWNLRHENSVPWVFFSLGNLTRHKDSLKLLSQRVLVKIVVMLELCMLFLRSVA